MSHTASGWRTRIGAAAAAVALLSLAACGGGSSQEQSGSATKGDITWWGWTPDQSNATKLIAAFNKQYPDIHVTFVAKPIDTYDSVLGPAITTKDGPDVFGVAPGSANGGVNTFSAAAVDLAPAAEKALGQDWKSKLATAGVEGLAVKDKIVGLSAGAVYSGNLWINKDIFDKYGLQPPTTLAEWESVCQKLKAAGQGCFVQGAGQWAFDMDTFEAIMENVEPGAYIKATKGEMKFTDPAFVTGMGIWKKLFDDGIMQDGAIGLQQYPDASNAFLSGKYAMVMMGSWYTQYTVKDAMSTAIGAAGVSNPKPFTLVPIPFPDVAGTGNVGNLFGDADYGFAVSAKSAHQAAATTFAVWLATSEGGQQAIANTLNEIPSLTSVQPQWDQIDLVNPAGQLDALKQYTESAAKATQPRFATVSPDLNTAFKDALIGVASGDASVEKALSNLQKVVDSAK